MQVGLLGGRGRVAQLALASGSPSKLFEVVKEALDKVAILVESS